MSVALPPPLANDHGARFIKKPVPSISAAPWHADDVGLIITARPLRLPANPPVPRRVFAKAPHRPPPLHPAREINRDRVITLVVFTSSKWIIIFQPFSLVSAEFMVPRRKIIYFGLLTDRNRLNIQHIKGELRLIGPRDCRES